MAEADVIEDLRRRVEALEKAQNTNAGTLKWVSGTLGQTAADVAALREETTKRFDKLEADIAGLRKDLPQMLTEAVREGIKKE
jgi:hypothetical protein